MRDKADKYKARQDAVLVHAIMRVWVSKERGLLLERAISMRRIQDAWQGWKARVQDLKALQSKFECYSSIFPFNMADNQPRQGRQVLRPNKYYYPSFIDDPLEADSSQPSKTLQPRPTVL